MGLGCKHDNKFIDMADDGTSHCVYCRCLAAEERLQKLEGTDDHPEHRCERCNGRNLRTWYADNDVWNRISGDYNILCPICFAELAADGAAQPTGWRLSVAGDSPEITKLHDALHNRLEEAATLAAEVKRLHAIDAILKDAGSSYGPYGADGEGVGFLSIYLRSHTIAKRLNDLLCGGDGELIAEGQEEFSDST